MPELLDELPPDDPRAVHSRGDLRRINKLMGNADIMAHALLEKRGRTPFSVKRGTAPFSIVELGGGDGTFLLELAKRVAPAIGGARAMLVDQQSLLSSETRDQFARLSWHVDATKADVFEWLQHRGPDLADVTVANLFLHHFEGERLAILLRDTSRQTRMFVACEPRRSGAALAAVSMVGLIGGNRVTVHDGRVSVRAGFRDQELSAIWPAGMGWSLEERQAGRFTHGFVAQHEEPRV